MSTNAEFDLRRQTEAARDLLASIRAQGEGDDADLVTDAIEGETDLNEAIGAAIDEIDECDIIEAGCDVKVAKIEGRKIAAVKRRERIRAAIERAMVTLDMPSLKLPTATLSIRKNKPQAVVDNEAEIPSRFFVQAEPPVPKLDKKSLASALADSAIAGAHLDNGSVTLSIRR